jgi:ABC-type Na+ efflux pump permease subunit
MAVVRRDLTVAAGSKAVVLPAVVVTLVLLVLLPALAGLAPRLVDSATVGDLDAVVGLLPADRLGELPDDPGLRAAIVAVTFMFAPMVLIVPVMVVAVIAADGIAGEKERRTLEGLLLTPLTDREIVTAKLLGAVVPAVVFGLGGAVVYATVANLAVGVQAGRLILPTPEYAVMVLWVGPTFAAASLGAVSLVSVRANTTQEAFQIGGVVVLPVVALLISQAAGALLLSVWLLAIAGAVALAIAAGLLRAGGRALSRARLGERLGGP